MHDANVLTIGILAIPAVPPAQPGGTQSFTYTGVHQETVTCEPPSNTSKEKLDGRSKHVKSLEVGVQIPRSFYTKISKKKAVC